MKKLRVGIIGCGVIAETHAWAIEQDGRAELTALCDIDKEKREVMNRNRNCRLFGNWKDMLAADVIDIAAVCLPHHLHEPAIIDSLGAGKHVICEKPLGVTLDQLKNIEKHTREAEARGIFSFGIFQHRYSSLINEIRSALNEGELGELISGEIIFRCTRTCGYYRQDAWRGSWDGEGGGTLINQGIHTLDILQYLLGKPAKAGFFLSRNRLECIDVEDKGTGYLYYPPAVLKSGKIELFFENDLKTEWEPVISLQGTGGSLRILGSDGFSASDPRLSERLSARIGEKPQPQSAPGKTCYGSLHSENYRDIFTALESYIRRNEYRPRVSLLDLAETTETVLALYQSHFRNTIVSLPLRNWIKPEKLKYTGEKA